LNGRIKGKQHRRKKKKSCKNKYYLSDQGAFSEESQDNRCFGHLRPSNTLSKEYDRRRGFYQGIKTKDFFALFAGSP